ECPSWESGIRFFRSKSVVSAGQDSEARKGQEGSRLGTRSIASIGVVMERRAIAVRGVVQGVGFRPFVYGLATHLGLSGFVRNSVGGALMEGEGDRGSRAPFRGELSPGPPPLARIDHLNWERRPPQWDGRFRIQVSEIENPGP